jgi:chromosome segregation ATPase
MRSSPRPATQATPTRGDDATRVAALELELEPLKSTFASLKSEYDSLLARHRKALDEKSDPFLELLQKQLTETDAVQAAEARAIERIGAQRHLADENAALKAQLADVPARKVEKLRAALAQQKAVAEQKNSEIANLSQKVARLQEASQRSSDEVKELRRTVATLRAENAKQAEKIEASSVIQRHGQSRESEAPPQVVEGGQQKQVREFGGISGRRRLRVTEGFQLGPPPSLAGDVESLLAEQATQVALMRTQIDTLTRRLEANTEGEDTSGLQAENRRLREEVKELGAEIIDMQTTNPELQAALEERKELRHENMLLHERIKVLDAQLRVDDDPLLADQEESQQPQDIERGIWRKWQSEGNQASAAPRPKRPESPDDFSSDVSFSDPLGNLGHTFEMVRDSKARRTAPGERPIPAPRSAGYRRFDEDQFAQLSGDEEEDSS